MQDATNWTGADLRRVMRHDMEAGIEFTIYGIDCDVLAMRLNDEWTYAIEAYPPDGRECLGTATSDPQAALDEMRTILRPWLPLAERDALALKQAIASGIQGALL